MPKSFLIASINIFFLIFIFLLKTSESYAQISFAPIFTDHCVLQRDTPISFWGSGPENTAISIQFNGQESKTVIKDGKWKVQFASMQAGGPFKIKLISGEKEIVLDDIWIGDVWLCSGQSNMEWTLQNTNNAKKEILDSEDKLIRHYKVPLNTSDSEKETMNNSKWEVNNPKNAIDFTAVGYYFAKEIREVEEVPIGILNSSWGGSRIEAWISEEILDSNHPEYNFENFQKSKTNESDPYKILKSRFPGITEKDMGKEGVKAIWSAIDLDDSQWDSIAIDQLWEEQGYQNFDGIAWYRTVIILSEKEAANPILFELGKIDDSDELWINGQMTHGTEMAYNKNRFYKVNSDYLNPGPNSILIRVADFGGGGGLYSVNNDQILTTVEREISLKSLNWKFKPSALFKSITRQHIPNQIYNQMIFPYKGFPIKGVLWYQGESNTSTAKEAFDYRYLLRSLIQNWRRDWQNTQLPFYIVSLANFSSEDIEPGPSNWAMIRESMTIVSQEMFNGQALTIDIGDPNDIHPRNKEDVGKRLARIAKAKIYEKDVIYKGPIYEDFKIYDNKIEVRFETFGDDLITINKYGYVNGFSVAGQDKKFHWAKAAISGNKVILTCDKVQNPIAVRYAWSNNPGEINLYNSAGLPAVPFRTDDWKQ